MPSVPQTGRFVCPLPALYKIIHKALRQRRRGGPSPGQVLAHARCPPRPSEQDFSPAVLENAAQDAGLDLKKFKEDMAAGKYKEQVATFKKQGLAAGLTGTPSFFVNGRPYELDPIVLPLERRVEMERDRGDQQCQ
ncbi:MAG: DsbA family protein [Myxococcota bacterium]